MNEVEVKKKFMRSFLIDSGITLIILAVATLFFVLSTMDLFKVFLNIGLVLVGGFVGVSILESLFLLINSKFYHDVFTFLKTNLYSNRYAHFFAFALCFLLYSLAINLNTNMVGLTDAIGLMRGLTQIFAFILGIIGYAHLTKNLEAEVLKESFLNVLPFLLLFAVLFIILFAYINAWFSFAEAVFLLKR